MNSTINTDLLMNALIFYTNLNYEPFSSPMLVDLDTIHSTILPTRNIKPKEHSNSNLFYVGSAEQSYIQLLKENKVSPFQRKMMLITPCQRDEFIYDETHLEIFLKIELIINGENSTQELLKDVLSFYKSVSIYPETVELGNDLFDLELNNIEIGSFGSRVISLNNKSTEYTYGTGLALPRISQAVGNF